MVPPAMPSPRRRPPSVSPLVSGRPRRGGDDVPPAAQTETRPPRIGVATVVRPGCSPRRPLPAPTPHPRPSPARSTTPPRRFVTAAAIAAVAPCHADAHTGGGGPTRRRPDVGSRGHARHAGRGSWCNRRRPAGRVRLAMLPRARRCGGGQGRGPTAHRPWRGPTLAGADGWPRVTEVGCHRVAGRVFQDGRRPCRHVCRPHPSAARPSTPEARR